MNQKCGECNLCCELLPVNSINKEPNITCKYCTPKAGCSIYVDRPEECSGFECAYYQMDKVNIALRPDNCKVIFEKISNNLFFGTQDFNYTTTDVAKRQVVAFNKQGHSIIISTSKNKNIYLAEGHTKELVLEDFKKYLKDRSN